MNVIIAGHTGTEKAEAISSLKKEISNQKQNYPPADSKEFKEFITDYCVEDYLPISIETWLQTNNKRRQKKLWLQAIDKVIEKMNQVDADHCFLSVHLTFRRKSRFFSPLRWSEAVEKFREMDIDCCITLIDDIYTVWDRIKEGSYLRLREILTWRNIEVLMADILAKQAISGLTSNV